MNYCQYFHKWVLIINKIVPNTKKGIQLCVIFIVPKIRLVLRNFVGPKPACPDINIDLLKMVNYDENLIDMNHYTISVGLVKIGFHFHLITRH